MAKTIDKDVILSVLPEYRNEWITVMQRQEVPHIMAEVFEAHKDFSKYYDSIGLLFEGSTIGETADNLYFFCKENIKYQEEGEDFQTTAVPAGILVRGHGDCKHYASFIAGCLAAIERKTGEKINWQYCFASYKLTQRTPYHVFVIVTEPDGSEIYIDPTPGADGKEPVWWYRQKVE